MKKALYIFSGAVLYSIGISVFLTPFDLIPGGVTGIAIILHSIYQVPVGTIILCLNIPILLLGLIRLGKESMLSTLGTILLVSAMSNVLSLFSQGRAITTNPLLAAFLGSALVGFGMGFIFIGRSTTGGIDIIVKIIKRKWPHMKSSRIFLLLDSLVVVMAGIVFHSPEALVYALLSSVIVSQSMEYLLYGRAQAKLIYIISRFPEKVRDQLLYHLQTGVTLLEAKGAYTGQRKEILFCVLPRKKVYLLEELVKESDPEAFLIVSNAGEIYGEGYKSLFEEKI